MAGMEWATEGADAAILTLGAGIRRVEFHKVDRVTKTQAVVNGRRFRLADGREVGRGGKSAWSASSQILSATDDWAVAAAKEQRLKRLQNSARTLAGDVDDALRAGDVEAACQKAEALVAAIHELGDVR